MTHRVDRYRCARTLKFAAVVLGSLVLFGGVQNAQASWNHCDRGWDRSGWSGGHGHWGRGHHRQAWHNHRAGTLVIDGRCFSISSRRLASDVVNAFRRCGYCASVYRTCRGLEVRVSGCPRVSWRARGCRPGIYRRYGSTILSFDGRF